MALSVVGLGAMPLSAAAAGAGTWAQWSPITGRSNDYSTSVQLAGIDFPKAVVATNSRGPVQLAGGVSTFLGDEGDRVPTPVGRTYGSSKGHQYLTLRPEADTPTTPSRTTYAFDRPTPPAGWAFVLGDIDADQVHVAATAADGRPVGEERIDTWFRDSFNYAGGGDHPTWDPASATLIGNRDATDTDGAAGWFEPDESLRSLTFVFTRRAGFPVYQTWFAALTRSITGRLTDRSTGSASCDLADASVSLLDPGGTRVATTRPGSDGEFRFDGVTAQPGWTVLLDAPGGCVGVGDDARRIDTAVGDATADFGVRRIVPQPISGKVTDSRGESLADVKITLTAPGGTSRDTVTDEHGQYLFDGNRSGTGYRVSVTSPDGYRTSGRSSRTVDVTDHPITDQDFTLARLPAISGTVSGGGERLGGVTVRLTDPGGRSVTTGTDGEGRYSFPGLDRDRRYTVTVTPPPGFGDASPRQVGVGNDDVDNVDFVLDRPGAVAGTITDASGRPVDDVAVTVGGGAGGGRTVHTDARGDYFAGGVRAGRHVITPTVPAQYSRAAPDRRAVTVSRTGPVLGALDFVLHRATGAPPTGPGGHAPTTSVADTGVPAAGLTAAALALLLSGAFACAVGRNRRRYRIGADRPTLPS